jgi:hypothetical protein
MLSKANDPRTAAPEIRDLSKSRPASQSDARPSRLPDYRGERLLRDQRDQILSA